MAVVVAMAGMIRPAMSLACHAAQANVLPTTIYAVRKDEMDIRKFVSRMGLIATFGWAVADASEDLIGEWRVNPGVCVSLLANNVKDLVPLNFVASMFRYWRGSLIYRLAIAKTRFHAGTIEVVWQMGYGVGIIDEDFEATNCYRAVWDIQESSAFEIYIPYVANLPWSKVMIEDQADATNSQPFYGNPNGFISLRVINPLVDGQGLASSKVEILVFARGGDDIEFAIPGVPSFGPPGGEMFGNGDLQPDVEMGVAEAGDGVFQDDESKELSSEGVPFIMAPSHPISDDALICCIGERVGNLRLLLKRFTSPTFLGLLSNTPVYVDPWMQLRSIHPFFAYLCQVFAFVSGGVRLQLSGGGGSYGMSLLYGPDIVYNGRAAVIGNVGDARVYNIPYQHVVPFVPVAQTSGVAGDFCGYRLVFVSYPSGNAGNFYGSFAGADDLNLGWQIGVPAMVLSWGTQTQQYCPSYVRYN